MPEAEAGFIALHIAEARYDSSIAHVETTAEILKSAMKIISLSYQIVLDEESLDYGRFVVHMKFCISRLFSNQMLCQDDEMFIKMIQTQYADAYACAEKIGEFISDNYGLNLTEDELIYLTVHIKRITDPN